MDPNLLQSQQLAAQVGAQKNAQVYDSGTQQGQAIGGAIAQAPMAYLQARRAMQEMQIEDEQHASQLALHEFQKAELAQQVQFQAQLHTLKSQELDLRLKELQAEAAERQLAEQSGKPFGATEDLARLVNPELGYTVVGDKAYRVVPRGKTYATMDELPLTPQMRKDWESVSSRRAGMTDEERQVRIEDMRSRAQYNEARAEQIRLEAEQMAPATEAAPATTATPGEKEQLNTSPNRPVSFDEASRVLQGLPFARFVPSEHRAKLESAMQRGLESFVRRGERERKAKNNTFTASDREAVISRYYEYMSQFRGETLGMALQEAGVPAEVVQQIVRQSAEDEARARGQQQQFFQSQTPGWR